MGAFPYQLIGARHLAEQSRAYLGDRPGLGKTIQALLAVLEVQPHRVLVVCPASMVGTWIEEIFIWVPGCRALFPSFEVMSYDRFIRRGAPKHLPDVVIIDEAHYLKNASTQRTKSLYGALWLDAVPHVWMMSGTPMPNGTHELYTACLFAGLTKFSYRQWLDRYCQWYMGEYGPRVVGPNNVPEFRRLLDGFMLRRTFDDVDLDLPERDVRRWPIALTPANRTALQAAISELPAGVLDALEAGTLPPNSPHTSTLRRQLGLAKATAVGKALVDELQSSGEQTVVFAYHRDVLNLLEHEFRNASFPMVRLDGSTPGPMRDHSIKLFQMGAAQIFLGQITAAGTGITLTAANHVIIVEPSWVPSENDQAISRCQRIGQKKNTVHVRVATLAGSLDDAIMGTVIRKQRTIDQVLDKEQ